MAEAAVLRKTVPTDAQLRAGIAAPGVGEMASAIGYRRRRAGWATPIAVRGPDGRAEAAYVPEASQGAELEQLRDAPDRERIRADQMTMAAIAAGDGRAFARVVADQSPVLLRFARSVLDTGGDEAEEVVQEALVRLWLSARAWQPTGRIATWLHRVAFRLCIDALRRRRPSVAIDDVADLIPDAAPLPSTRLARIDDVRSIRAAITALPARQRVAIVLCHFQGLNQAEGAAVMGVGEHAYESLLSRARRNLRTALSKGRATP
jgi:RNA polymerase sigma-70 factor (ECF subfamily)